MLGPDGSAQGGQGRDVGAHDPDVELDLVPDVGEAVEAEVLER